VDAPCYPSVDNMKVSLCWELEAVLADVLTTAAEVRIVYLMIRRFFYVDPYCSCFSAPR